MTSATFSSGSNRASTVAAKRSLPASLAAQAQAAFMAPRAVASAVSAYPWMTQTMLAAMSPRARRLLRADY